MRKLLDYCTVSGISVKEFTGEKKYIATGDVIDNKIVSFENVDYKNKPSRANQVVKNGEVLFAKMKGTQKVLLIKDELSDNIYSTGFFVIKANENVLPEYLYWLFNSSKFNQDKDKNSKGATQQAINLEGLNKILIKEIPQLDEQRKIITEIEKTFDILELKKKQLRHLDELIKSQFVDMFGSPFYNEKWEIKKIGNMAEIISDGNNIEIKYYQETGDVLFLRIQNVWRNEFRLNDSVYVSKEVNNMYIDTSLHTGDILISKIGRYYTKDSSLGRVALYRGENDKANYSNNIIRVRLKPEYNSEFVNIVLNLEDYQQYIRRESKGGTDKRALSKKIIENFEIINPPIKLQNEYIGKVKLIDKQKVEIQNSLEEMQKLQESLMNQYFGE